VFQIHYPVSKLVSSISLLYPAIFQANLKQTVPHMKQQAPYHFIDQFNQRDEHAFYNLFNQFYPSIVSFANKLIQNNELAQEICSDSFIKLYQSKEIFAGLDNVKAYLFTITRNGCYDAIKKLKHHTQVQKQLLQALESDNRNFVAEQEIQSELVELISLSIEKLPGRCRRIFRMLFSGMSAEEIALALNLSISTVRNQKARGLKILKRTILKEQGLHVAAVTVSIVLLEYLSNK
jgi:RNA polymerase sigma-70 factor (ECF subfamily)